jgi:glycosyltransferase involved in cell wall biosynthesis
MKKKIARKLRVALVTGWADPARLSLAEISLNLLNTLKPLSSRLTWLATNLTTEIHPDGNINLVKIKTRFIPRRDSTLKLIPYMLLFQFKVAWAALKSLPKVDLFVFATGSDYSFLPMLLVKLAGKKVILRSDGRPSVAVKKYFQKPDKTKIALLRIIEGISYRLADKILPESECMIHLYHLEGYSSKTSYWSQYIDTSIFRKAKGLAERTYNVGYIGRLIKEKGALKFVESLPLILKDKRDRAIVIGDGEQRAEIERFLSDNDIRSQVDFLGWVEKRQLPDFLNDVRLIVVPSDYEGLPSGVLEAMACGTPVLATPVGGIPDLVREGETGFFMENNTPQCIAQNTIRSLKHPSLEQISGNAQALIKEQYTYEAVTERCKQFIEALN